jgi:PAS domain S-box-containing protein
MNYLPNAQPYPSLPGATLGAEGLLDALPWGMLVLDEQHIIRRVNQQAARWCGALPDALLGLPLAEATLPPALRMALLQLLEPAEPAPHEVWLPELAQWIALSAARHPGSWVLYAQDITPQKQREQQYQTLADNTPDVLTRWTPDLRLHYANAAFATKAGQPVSTVLGRTFGEMGAPAEVTAPYMAALQRVFDTGQPQEHYNPFPTPHGTTYYYSRLVPELRDGRVETVLGIARDITELRHTQAEALRLRDGLMQHATDQYQTLFHTLDQGFCVMQVVFDEASRRLIDFRYLEINPAFARQSGLPADALGKSIRELIPDLEPFWFETYGRVAQTGNTERFEHYVPQLGRWFDVHAFRVGAAEVDQVAERKQQEATMRASEARQVFRLHLSDAMRQLTNPVAIQATVAQMLGQHLGVDWVGFLELDEAAEAFVVAHDWHQPGTPAHARRYPRASWRLPWLLSGQPWVVRDITTDLLVPAEQQPTYHAQHVRALVVVPLLRQGQLVALLVASQATPRTWTLPEVSLIKETMERTWAAVGLAHTEEARHASEQRLRAVMENLPGGAVFVVDAGLRYQVAEGAAIREAGLRTTDFVGRSVQELVSPALWADYQRLYGQALAGQPFEYEHEQGGRTFATRGGPLHTADGSVAAVLAVSYDITARKRAEAALKESSEKYRTLFNSIDEGYCIIEVLFDSEGQPNDWRFVEVNPAFEKNNGLANATGKTIRELTPNIEPKWFATYGRVAQTGQPLRFEEDSVALGRWFSLYAFAVGEPGSNLVAVLFTDITARKQAEDALRLSESRLSLALQAGRMGSFEWTADGDRISLSAMSYEVLGMLPGTSYATSKEGFELLHPDDRARHQALFAQAGRTGEDFHSIFRIVRPRDGQVRWIEERGQGMHDASGVCLRGVHWDVTETMLAQQRLAEFNNKLEQRVARRTRDLQASRDLLQSVFDTSLFAMSVMEAVRDDAGAVQDLRLRLVSREVMRETGRTDLVGKLYSVEYPGVREVGILALAIKALETGEPQHMEYYYPYEGFDKWYACQFVKLGDGVVATNLDITERKAAEQELLKNLRLLEQAEAVAGLGSWDYELATRTMRWSGGMYRVAGLLPQRGSSRRPGPGQAVGAPPGGRQRRL